MFTGVLFLRDPGPNQVPMFVLLLLAMPRPKLQNKWAIKQGIFKKRRTTTMFMGLAWAGDMANFKLESQVKFAKIAKWNFSNTLNLLTSFRMWVIDEPNRTGPYLYMLITFNKDRSMGHLLGICFAWKFFYVWNSSWSQPLKNLRFRVHSATSYFSFKLTLAQRPKGKIRIYIAPVLPLSCMPKHFWLFLLKKHLSAKYFIFCKSKFQCLRTRSPSKSSSRN